MKNYEKTKRGIEMFYKNNDIKHYPNLDYHVLSPKSITNYICFVRKDDRSTALFIGTSIIRLYII